MGAFRVFGTSWQKVYDDLYKKTQKGNNESVSEFDRRILAMADAAFAACDDEKPVSEKCDAPQFCREFIAMADPARFKNLHTRVNAFTGVIDPKTRKPKFSWVRYDPLKEYKTVPQL